MGRDRYKIMDSKLPHFLTCTVLHWIPVFTRPAMVDIVLDSFKGNRAYKFWQEGYHPVWLQNETMLRQKVEYIHQNPVKRGYVDESVHWRYSSARNYAGVDGLLDVCLDW